jgi:hypothetical protein
MDSRVFNPTISYSTHFLGLELHVTGLAFQQQDKAVAACATTAVWTALQRVCRTDGGRAPTPAAISQAAVRHYLPGGRGFPSTGLTVAQMCEALRSFEFAPELFHVGGEPSRFRTLIHIYLRSGIPVILALRGAGVGHAVTAVGYRRTRELAAAPFASPTFGAHNLAYDRLYIHDDRIGPYARAKLLEIPAEEVDELDEYDEPKTQRRLRLEFLLPNRQTHTLAVSSAIVPLYPKLRSSAAELLENAITLIPLVESECPSGNSHVDLELSFDRSGSYLSSLYSMRIDPRRLIGFLRTAALSRYVGVARYLYRGRRFLDVLWDTTDTVREGAFRDHVLGMVVYDDRYRASVDRIGTELNVPVA